MNRKFIVDTMLCKIEVKGMKLVPYIRLTKGGWIQHASFDNDLKGTVAALMLATDVNAGKFYPESVISDNELEASAQFSPKSRLTMVTKVLPDSSDGADKT